VAAAKADSKIIKDTASKPEDKAKSAATKAVLSSGLSALYAIAKDKDPKIAEFKLPTYEAFRGGQQGYTSGGAARPVIEISAGMYKQGMRGRRQGFGGMRGGGPEFEDVPNYVLQQEDKQQEAINAYSSLRSMGQLSNVSWPEYWKTHQNSNMSVNLYEMQNPSAWKSINNASTGPREARSNRMGTYTDVPETFTGNNPYGVQGFRQDVPVGGIY
jgi:hypothetical protein